MKDASGEDHEARRDLIATARRHGPGQSLVIPHRSGDVGLEQRLGVEVEAAGEELRVLEDLRRAGISLGRHEADLFEEREVDVGLDVAHATRVAVPVPGAAEIACLLDDPDVGDPMAGEVDGGEHAGKPAAHDQRSDGLDDRLPGEPGFDERVAVELVVEVAPLGHALGTDALLLLRLVALPELVDREPCILVLRPGNHAPPRSAARLRTRTMRWKRSCHAPGYRVRHNSSSATLITSSCRWRRRM